MRVYVPEHRVHPEPYDEQKIVDVRATPLVDNQYNGLFARLKRVKEYSGVDLATRFYPRRCENGCGSFPTGNREGKPARQKNEREIS